MTKKIIILLMAMILAITTAPNKASAQDTPTPTPYNQWVVLFHGNVIVSCCGSSSWWHVDPAPFSVEVFCGSDFWGGETKGNIFLDDVLLQSYSCFGSSPIEIPNIQGHKLQYSVSNSHNVASATVNVRIRAIDQVNWPTVQPTPFGQTPTWTPTGTPTGTPTNTPTVTPTGGTGGGPGGNGSTCGMTQETACHVTFPTTLSGPGGGGGGFPYGEGTALPVAITNLPATNTPIPIIETAIANQENPPTPAPAVYEQMEQSSELYAEGAENNDSYTAAVVHSKYDFGCPIDAGSYGLDAGICVQYDYIESITLIGFAIPVGAISTFMLVCVVIYIIRKR